MKRARCESDKSDGKYLPKRVNLEGDKEKLYFGIFTDISEPPLEIADKVESLWDAVDIPYTSIPIQNLSHATHTEEKNQILKEKCCTFRPSPKNGRKDYSIFIDNKTGKRDEIGDGSRLLPGYLSWWGVNTAEWYDTDIRGKELRKAIDELHNEHIYVPNFLQSPESSSYGGYSLIVSFQDLIQHYKESRRNCRSKNVYLLKAGTLQYKYEHCYVIMVCMEEDRERDAQLAAMSSVYGENIFKSNGCINKEGKIVNLISVPSFRAQNLVKVKYREGETRYEYEEIAFAFYFEEDQKFLIPKAEEKTVEVSHNDKFCIKKKWNEEESRYTCPDQQ